MEEEEGFGGRLMVGRESEGRGGRGRRKWWWRGEGGKKERVRDGMGQEAVGWVGEGRRGREGVDEGGRW